MHGQARPYFVYGILEAGHEKCLDYEFVEEEGLDIYVKYIVRNYGGRPIYGMHLAVDENTGAFTGLDEETKAKIDALAEELGLKAGYHVAVQGWDQELYSYYTPAGREDNPSKRRKHDSESEEEEED